MEFWGVRVKAKEPLVVPVVHITQASLDFKGDKNAIAQLYLKVGQSALYAIGSLSQQKSGHMTLVQTIEESFCLSHNLREGMVHFAGYKTPNLKSLFSTEEDKPPAPTQIKDSAKKSDKQSKKTSVTNATDSGPVPAIYEGSLKRLFIPKSLIREFSERAKSNTEMRLETCGLLVGSLGAKGYRIKKLIIPQQTSKPDSCQSENEEEIVKKQGDLVSLGWIHTHPTQTRSMSSIDLHTQFTFQKQREEAVSIVVAPTDRDGTYQLSSYGISVIGECQLDGAQFHEHKGAKEDDPLYQFCLHVVFEDLKLKVVDLRHQTTQDKHQESQHNNPKRPAGEPASTPPPSKKIKTNSKKEADHTKSNEGKNSESREKGQKRSNQKSNEGKNSESREKGQKRSNQKSNEGKNSESREKGQKRSNNN